jgi:hypothetical protein
MGGAVSHIADGADSQSVNGGVTPFFMLKLKNKQVARFGSEFRREPISGCQTPPRWKTQMVQEEADRRGLGDSCEVQL